MGEGLCPEGFSNFESIEEMPQLPTPHHTGRLRATLIKDVHIFKQGHSLNRLLLKEISSGTDNLLMCCACVCIEAMLEVTGGVLTVPEDAVRAAPRPLDNRTIEDPTEVKPPPPKAGDSDEEEMLVCEVVDHTTQVTNDDDDNLAVSSLA